MCAVLLGLAEITDECSIDVVGDWIESDWVTPSFPGWELFSLFELYSLQTFSEGVDSILNCGSYAATYDSCPYSTNRLAVW